MDANTRPASTGGERDEQDREHDMDLAYAKGWNDAREGAVPARIFDEDGTYVVMAEDDDSWPAFDDAVDEMVKSERCYLLPRQVEGDPNPTGGTP